MEKYVEERLAPFNHELPNMDDLTLEEKKVLRGLIFLKSGNDLNVDNTKKTVSENDLAKSENPTPVTMEKTASLTTSEKMEPVDWVKTEKCKGKHLRKKNNF